MFKLVERCRVREWRLALGWSWWGPLPQRGLRVGLAAGATERWGVRRSGAITRFQVAGGPRSRAGCLHGEGGAACCAYALTGQGAENPKCCSPRRAPRSCDAAHNAMCQPARAGTGVSTEAAPRWAARDGDNDTAAQLTHLAVRGATVATVCGVQRSRAAAAVAIVRNGAETARLDGPMHVQCDCD